MSEVRITDPVTGGQKGRKPERYDLIPFDALDEVARVYGVGASKYSDDNWLKGYAWRLSAGALLRHVARFMCGEDRDPETGCLHLAHACWHCLTLMTFFMRGLGTDDRAPPKCHGVIPGTFITCGEVENYCSEGENYFSDACTDEPIPYKPVEPKTYKRWADIKNKAPKFREGDVVRWGTLDREAVVLSSAEDWTSVSYGPGFCGKATHRTELLTLLRRPVREGDLVCHDNTTPLRVLKLYTDMVKFEGMSVMWLDGVGQWPSNWTHADGTPIEPPPAPLKDEPVCGAV